MFPKANGFQPGMQPVDMHSHGTSVFARTPYQPGFMAVNTNNQGAAGVLVATEMFPPPHARQQSQPAGLAWLQNRSPRLLAWLQGRMSWLQTQPAWIWLQEQPSWFAPSIAAAVVVVILLCALSYSRSPPPAPVITDIAPLPIPRCGGSINVVGHGPLELILEGDRSGSGGARTDGHHAVYISPGTRAYLGTSCSEDAPYMNFDYASLDLVGYTLSYNVDLSAAQCGCIAALYLTAMQQNLEPGNCGGDYYCDSGAVCGVNCAELDIQEANIAIFKTTMHSAEDPKGLANQIPPWGDPDPTTTYGFESSCINSNLPFTVEASFPPSGLETRIKLSQNGCTAFSNVTYSNFGTALHSMTPVFSYWFTEKAKDLKWFDGDVCDLDAPTSCGESVIFSDFSIQAVVW